MTNSKRDYLNKYDLLIILLIATLAWGNNEALRFLYPIRVLGFAGLFVVASKWSMLSRIYWRWLPFMMAWFAYALCSVVWTPDRGSAFIQLVHIFCLFGAMGLLMYSSLKSNNPKQSIILGWVVMVLITLPIAFWELTTGDHLSSGSHNADNMSYGQLRMFAAVTFGNLNSYAVLLASALPFILTGWLGDKEKTPFRLLLIAMTIVMAGILILNSSRGCLLCLAIGILLMLFFQMKGSFSLLKIVLTIAIMVGAAYVAIEKFELDLFWEINQRLENEGTEFGREDIYLEGVNIALQNPIGGGVGSTVPLYKMTKCAVKVSHSCFLEILIEYGLIIFLLFWYKFYTAGIRMCRSNDVKLNFMGLYFITTSIFLFSVDDYYTGESLFWIYTATLIVLSTLYGRAKNSCYS